MIKVLLFDFSRTLIQPKPNSFTGKLNDLYREVISKEGFNFYNHFYLNQELLTFIKTLKNKYILAIYTTDILQNDPAVKPILDEIFNFVFAANDLNISKRESNGYNVIAERLKVNPNEIFFVDDLLANVEAAQEAGLQAIQFISNEQLFNELENKLSVH